MFGQIEVLAGDFKASKNGQFAKGFLLPVSGSMTRESISAKSMTELTVATEESVKRIGGTVGWGLVGGAALGGLGLLAGLIAGGQGKDVIFVCQFDDGRKLLGRTDSKTYQKMQAAFFDKDKPEPFWTVKRQWAAIIAVIVIGYLLSR